MVLQKITEFSRSLFQTVFSLLKIIILSKFFVRLRKHGTNENECVILGNGPCLKTDFEKNWTFITNRKKICVNLFAFSKEYDLLKPEYYVLAAPEFFIKKTTDLHKISRERLVKEIVERTGWQMTLLTPFAAKDSELLRKLKSNKNIKIVHFNSTPVEGFKSVINFLYKLNLGIPRPHNVLIPSIYLALNLGFKKIFIFGADHSWHEEIRIDKYNKATVNHEHFYDKSEDRMPMYKLDGKEYHIHDIFRKLHFAFKGYFVLKDYADHMDSKILNASSKSYIDAFEKTKIN